MSTIGNMEPASIDDDAGDRGETEADAADMEGEDVNEVNADEFELMLKRFAQEPIPVRVAEVLVEGNSKTRSSVIQAHLEPLKKAETTRQLLHEAAHVVRRIESTELFENCILSLETGPVQGSVNVVLHVQERQRPFSLDLGAFSHSKDQNADMKASIMWRNLLGFGETWDASGSYVWDEDHGFNAGFHFPWFKCLPNALIARVSVSTPEWLTLSSWKVRMAGVSVGLYSDYYQDLSCNLSWQTLQDDDHANGHGLPSLKYSFKVDERDSMTRPTKGHAFRFATKLAGGGLDVSQYSACQDVDFRFAIPLGTYNAALNIGLSGGFMLPWAKEYSTKRFFSSERYFVGRHSSLVCKMNGPSTILDFIARGAKSSKPKQGDNVTKVLDSSPYLGSSLAATGFADLSFDLPFIGLRRQGMYGHCFACAGNLVDLREAGRGSHHFQSFFSSFKYFIGAGIIIPTKLFRLEVNFCQMLGPHLNNESKHGIQIGFSSSS